MKDKKKLVIGIVIGVLFIILVCNLITLFDRNGISLFTTYENYEDISYIEGDYPACRDIEELDEETKNMCQKFLDLCRKEGLPVIVIETYRSQERQDYLYAQGRVREGPQVTWTKNSYHTSRRAFDIAKDEKGNEFGDDEFFRRCAEIGEGIGLEAGYFWKDYQDKGHFQN